MRQYKACAYLRLSQSDDDKSREDESNSITNQRNLIEEYVSRNPDIILEEEKVDDGFSGIYFDRPSFQEMIRDIEAGKIDCVIVKDLSRFGRNYIESGRYQKYFFSLYHVRFIAINDNIDMKPGEDSDTNIMLPFKNIINDSFSRDISVKTKSHLDIRRKNGLFLSAFAPYGYRKRPEDKNQLIPDAYAAMIVCEIFAWKLEGFSTTQIAEKLNNLGVMTPGDYKASLNLNYCTPFKIYDKSKWNAVMVKRILINDVYIGNLTQGKSKKINLKIKKSVQLSPEQWIHVENTHEPIVKSEDFDLVQHLISMDSRERLGENRAYSLSGFLSCSNCRQQMNHKLVSSNGSKYPYYICSAYQRDNKACTSHLINAQILESALFLFIRQYILLAVDMKFILDRLQENKIFIPLKIMKKQNIMTSRLEQRMKKIRSLKASVYGDWKEGLLKKYEYQELNLLYQEQCNELRNALKEVKKNYKKSIGDTLEKNQWIEELIQFQTIKRLPKELLAKILNQVVVYDHKRIQIDFRFHSELNKIL